jgi:hypothetical protein
VVLVFFVVGFFAIAAHLRDRDVIGCCDWLHLTGYRSRGLPAASPAGAHGVQSVSASVSVLLAAAAFRGAAAG